MKVDPALGHAAIENLHATLERMRTGTGPILVGPWLTEVGYELLYWIPFVAWAQREYHLDPERLIVISRGGAQSWYAHLASRYLDIFSVMAPGEFRRGNEARIASTGAMKHFWMGPLDHEILQRLTPDLRGEVEILHPSLMYQLFWAHRPWTPEFLEYMRPYPFRPVTPLDGLPDRYVAVRFYTSAICPSSPETRRIVSDAVRGLLKEHHVVLMNTGVQCDDHHEFSCAEVQSPRLHRIADRLTPDTNLDVQTRVIAGASKFVGTYGGYAYLPPFLGVNAKTVYGYQPAVDKLRRHIATARRVFASRQDYGSLGIRALQAPHQVYAHA
jgi:hypothetical protein